MSFHYFDIPLSNSITSRQWLHFPAKENPLTKKDRTQVPLLNFDVDTEEEREINYSFQNFDYHSFFFRSSNTKYSNKLFGYEIEKEKEKETQDREKYWIIHPCSSFRLLWIIILVLLLVAYLVISPVIISFFADVYSKRTVLFHCLFDFVFILDVFVNYRTGIIVKNSERKVILNSKQVAWHYFTSWFIIDILSSLPLDYIYLLSRNNRRMYSIINAGQAIRIIRITKILSLFRFLRVFRLVRYVLEFEKMLNLVSRNIAIMNTSLLIFLLTHWCTCFQFFVSMIMDFSRYCWVNNLGIKNKSWSNQYFWSLHKTLFNMLSIERGQYPPICLVEAWITTIVMILGKVLGILFAIQLMFLLMLDIIRKTIYDEKLEQVERYMTQKKIVPQLKTKIIDFYSYRCDTNIFEFGKFPEELPESLRKEVMTFTCQDLLMTSKLFQVQNSHFLSDVAAVLKIELFQPGDYIFTEGSVGKKMYFIVSGKVSINTNDGKLQSNILNGSSFGDLCLFSECIRTADFKAETLVKLYSLDKDNFHLVLAKYPTMLWKYRDIAENILLEFLRNPSLQERLQALENAAIFTNTNEAFPNLSTDDRSFSKMELFFQGIINDFGNISAPPIETTSSA